MTNREKIQHHLDTLSPGDTVIMNHKESSFYRIRARVVEVAKPGITLEYFERSDTHPHKKLIQSYHLYESIMNIKKVYAPGKLRDPIKAW